MNTKKLIPILFNALSGIFPTLAARVAIEFFLTPGSVSRRPEEIDLLKTAQEIRFSSGCIGQSWGEGPVVFLCHGWGSRGTRFFNIIPHIVAQGYKVVVWDAPAHGFSPGKKTNLPVIAKSLNDDLNNSKLDPVAFIGHSMGGVILGVMQKYYRQLPEKIVIVASPTRIAKTFERFFAMIKLSAKAQQIFITTVRIKSGYTFDDLSLVNCDLGKTTQALVFHDTDDSEVPYSDFLALQEIWDKSIFETTEDLGHRRILDDQSVINKIITYLGKAA
ncbi:MAG: pimeloyl-ACP methyl ester carboxylesterase [Enterobacterales bacterium]|jgi:pimeloyl-ACP methyl ester carboxylesterase